MKIKIKKFVWKQENILKIILSITNIYLLYLICNKFNFKSCNQIYQYDLKIFIDGVSRFGKVYNNPIKKYTLPYSIYKHNFNINLFKEFIFWKNEYLFFQYNNFQDNYWGKISQTS